MEKKLSSAPSNPKDVLTQIVTSVNAVMKEKSRHLSFSSPSFCPKKFTDELVMRIVVMGRIDLLCKMIDIGFCVDTYKSKDGENILAISVRLDCYFVAEAVIEKSDSPTALIFAVDTNTELNCFQKARSTEMINLLEKNIHGAYSLQTEDQE